MPQYQLHCFAQSGNAYRAALMLNLIGADWEPVWVDFFKAGVQRTPEFRGEVNEMGEIPVLVEGKKKLTQSGVILTYLADKTGKFRPEGEDEKLEALRWMLFDNQKVNGYLGPFRAVKNFTPNPNQAILDFLKGRFDNTLGIVNKRLEKGSVPRRPAADHRRRFARRVLLLSRRGIRLRHRQGLSGDRRLARTHQGAPWLGSPLRPDAGPPAAALTIHRMAAGLPRVPRVDCFKRSMRSRGVGKMFGVARVIALAGLASLIAGCVTDGMVDAEAETQAKPRVIDTPKTRTSAKKDTTKPAPEAAQGDTGTRVAAVKSEPDMKVAAAPPSPPRTQGEGTLIPAQSLFGNWTLGLDGGAKCRLILGGVPIGTAYAARGESDCPKAYTTVQTWEIQGDELVLRNQSRGIVGRLSPTGPYRFDGQGGDGAAVYLVR